MPTQSYELRDTRGKDGLPEVVRCTTITRGHTRRIPNRRALMEGADAENVFGLRDVRVIGAVSIDGVLAHIVDVRGGTRGVERVMAPSPYTNFRYHYQAIAPGGRIVDFGEGVALVHLATWNSPTTTKPGAMPLVRQQPKSNVWRAFLDGANKQADQMPCAIDHFDMPMPPSADGAAVQIGGITSHEPQPSVEVVLFSLARPFNRAAQRAEVFESASRDDHNLALGGLAVGRTFDW